jgi:hypothetical protein
MLYFHLYGVQLIRKMIHSNLREEGVALLFDEAKINRFKFTLLSKRNRRRTSRNA